MNTIRRATDFDGGERLESATMRRANVQLCDVNLEDGYSQYESEFVEEQRADLRGVWQLATIEANGHVDRFAELLREEHPRGLARKDFLCLNEMRAMLREQIMARIIAERTLECERGKR